jgi:DNA-binding response OmpR family regulator
MPRLLIVDSDSGFVRVLSKRFEAAGCDHLIRSAPPPLDELAMMRLGAIVIDPSVLGPHAWEFIERVRERLPGIVLVVCAGRSTVGQRVRGLRLGADDWITKPCHPEEVLARVEAAIRRGKRVSVRRDAEPLRAGELEIRLDRFELSVRGRRADLTRREFELLQLLAESRGQVLEREQVYRSVWGYEMARGDRSVDVFVRRLRHKLRALSPGWTYIHTHFGIGYRFEPERMGQPDRVEGSEPEGAEAALSKPGSEPLESARALAPAPR